MVNDEITADFNLAGELNSRQYLNQLEKYFVNERADFAHDRRPHAVTPSTKPVDHQRPKSLGPPVIAVSVKIVWKIIQQPSDPFVVAPVGSTRRRRSDRYVQFRTLQSRWRAVLVDIQGSTTPHPVRPRLIEKCSYGNKLSFSIMLGSSELSSNACDVVNGRLACGAVSSAH